MRITNYNELFELFDKIISLTSDEDVFYCVNFTSNFRFIISSYDKSSVDNQSRCARRSYAGLLAASSLGVPSLISSHDKKMSNRYHLSFMKVFPVILSYIREPLNYYVYNLYPKDKVFISHDLFANDVNLAGFYNNKFFIVHHYNEYNENTPFITVLSPSVMFEGEAFDIIED